MEFSSFRVLELTIDPESAKAKSYVGPGPGPIDLESMTHSVK